MTETPTTTPVLTRWNVAAVLALLTVIALALAVPALARAVEPSPERKAEVRACVEANIDRMVRSVSTVQCV